MTWTERVTDSPSPPMSANIQDDHSSPSPSPPLTACSTDDDVVGCCCHTKSVIKVLYKVSSNTLYLRIHPSIHFPPHYSLLL